MASIVLRDFQVSTFNTMSRMLGYGWACEKGDVANVGTVSTHYDRLNTSSQSYGVSYGLVEAEYCLN